MRLDYQILLKSPPQPYLLDPPLQTTIKCFIAVVLNLFSTTPPLSTVNLG